MPQSLTALDPTSAASVATWIKYRESVVHNKLAMDKLASEAIGNVRRVEDKLEKRMWLHVASKWNDVSLRYALLIKELDSMLAKHKSVINNPSLRAAYMLDLNT